MSDLEAPSCCQPLVELMDPVLFKALSDPNRLAILCELAGGAAGQRVTSVARCCPVDLSVVSRHLSVLRRAGVLRAERQGKEVRYTVRTRWLAGRLRALADAIESCCPEEPGAEATSSGPQNEE